MYFEIMWLHMPTKVLIPLKRVLKKSTGFFYRLPVLVPYI